MEQLPPTKEKKQYIMALVHLPIEITPNGSCEPMSNHIHISFEPCDVLPKPTNPSETAAFAAHFRGILSSFSNSIGEDQTQEPVFQKIRLEEDNDQSDEEVEDDDNESVEEDEDKSNAHQENQQEPNLSVLHVLQSEIQQHNRKIKQQFDITFKKRDKTTRRHTAKLR
jgi:hypothetical protein